MKPNTLFRVALLVAVLGAAAVLPCLGVDFMIGATHEEVLDDLGDPTREIQTGNGMLLFYGSLFMELANDAVVYINVDSPASLERKQQLDAERGVFWGRRRTAAEPPVPPPQRAGRRSMTDTERAEWLEARERRREQTIEFRVRRFLLSETFRSLFVRDGLAMFAAHFVPFSYPDCVSLLHLKDSRGLRVPACGEDERYVDRHVSVEDAFVAPLARRAR